VSAPLAPAACGTDRAQDGGQFRMQPAEPELAALLPFRMSGTLALRTRRASFDLLSSISQHFSQYQQYHSFRNFFFRVDLA